MFIFWVSYSYVFDLFDLLFFEGKPFPESPFEILEFKVTMSFLSSLWSILLFRLEYLFVNFAEI